MEKMIAPKRISSGQYIDLNELRPEDVRIEDINKALNYLYRFTGHWKDKPPLTVAQHTMLTIHMAEMFFPGEKVVAFDCLLHDMPEAYYGDLATPLKKLFGKRYRRYAEGIDKVVYDKLWLYPEPFTEEVYLKRKTCDLLSLDIERRSMWSSQYGKALWPEVPENPFSLKEKQKIFDEVQEERYVDLVDLYIRMLP